MKVGDIEQVPLKDVGGKEVGTATVVLNPSGLMVIATEVTDPTMREFIADRSPVSASLRFAEDEP